MAMDAARLGDKQICPVSEGGKPHLKGEVISGEFSVLICGKPAARKWDWLLCEGAVHRPNFIVGGREDVLIGGNPAARKWDQTLHGGLISSGCSKVLIGADDFDPIAAAIARIAISPYGQTPAGQALIKKLNKLRAEGKITIEPPKGGVHASTDLDTDAIEVYSSEGNLDVESVASRLVHEGTHAMNNDRQRNGEVIDQFQEEKSAWDAQNEFYRGQREQGAAPDKTDMKYDEAEDREEALRDGHSEDYWKKNETYWKEYREKHGK